MSTPTPFPQNVPQADQARLAFKKKQARYEAEEDHLRQEIKHLRNTIIDELEADYELRLQAKDATIQQLQTERDTDAQHVTSSDDKEVSILEADNDSASLKADLAQALKRIQELEALDHRSHAHRQVTAYDAQEVEFLGTDNERLRDSKMDDQDLKQAILDGFQNVIANCEIVTAGQTRNNRALGGVAKRLTASLKNARGRVGHWTSKARQVKGPAHRDAAHINQNLQRAEADALLISESLSAVTGQMNYIHSEISDAEKSTTNARRLFGHLFTGLGPVPHARATDMPAPSMPREGTIAGGTLSEYENIPFSVERQGVKVDNAHRFSDAPKSQRAATPSKSSTKARARPMATAEPQDALSSFDHARSMAPVVAGTLSDYEYDQAAARRLFGSSDEDEPTVKSKVPTNTIMVSSTIGQVAEPYKSPNVSAEPEKAYGKMPRRRSGSIDEDGSEHETTQYSSPPSETESPEEADPPRVFRFGARSLRAEGSGQPKGAPGNNGSPTAAAKPKSSRQAGSAAVTNIRHERLSSLGSLRHPQVPSSDGKRPLKRKRSVHFESGDVKRRGGLQGMAETLRQLKVEEEALGSKAAQ